MFKTKSLYLSLFGILIIIPLCFAQEQLTITTYYPSPYGSYRELRSQRMAIGDTYINNSVVCWENCPVGVTPVPAATDLVVEGNVGIGTNNPARAKLEVQGGAIPGIYAGSNNIGVYGYSFSNIYDYRAAGVRGKTFKGFAGVYGENFYGRAGVYGINFNGTAGIYGYNFNGTAGIYGSSYSGTAGVYGDTLNGRAGVYGYNSNGFAGVYGENPNGTAGIYGSNSNGFAGVYGDTLNGRAGVYGYNSNGFAGIFGDTLNGRVGVYGHNYRGFAGVYGRNNVRGGYGVIGRNTEVGIGVLGVSYNEDFPGQGIGVYGRGGFTSVYATGGEIGVRGSGSWADFYSPNNTYKAGSSRKFKKDISYFSSQDYKDILEKLSEIKVIRYRHKDQTSLRKRLGIIAEEAPEEIVSEDRETISLSDEISFVLACVKALKEENLALKKELAQLKKKVRR